MKCKYFFTLDFYRSVKEMEEWVKAINDAIFDNIRKRTCKTPDIDQHDESVQLGKVVSDFYQCFKIFFLSKL